MYADNKKVVLVVGAGPTGLTVACELLRRQIPVRIIDLLPAPMNQSRALGIQTRTLETFERMGILKQILSEGNRIDSLSLHRGRSVFQGPSFSRLKTRYPFVLILPQAKTEKILNDHLESLGGKVERSVSLLHAQEKSAKLLHSDGRKEIIHPRWIIGCDGAHSAVRHSLNLSFKGAKFLEGFCLADVTLSYLFPKHQVQLFLAKKGLAAIFPLLEKNQFRVVLEVPQGFKESDFSIEFLQHELRERTKLALTIEEHTWTSLFYVHRRIVSTLRKGAIFLCGDAAHIHSPMGGQGLNISVQDSFNLAWKLALVYNNQASETLLDTYHQERYPIAKKVIRETTLLTQITSSQNKFLQKIFYTFFFLLMRFSFVKNKMAIHISEIDTHYSFLAFPEKEFFWKGPKAGQWAPLLDNPIETRYTLLIFGTLHFGPTLDPALFVIKNYDLDHPIAKVYCAKKGSLYMIRPDGYIAFRMQKWDERVFKKCLALQKIHTSYYTAGR